MCVIAKFGDAPRLSPNGTFLSRFQKCNPSFRTSPLHSVMLRCCGPSSDTLPRSEASGDYYKVFVHNGYLRIMTFLIYVKVLLHVITDLYYTYVQKMSSKQKELKKEDVVLKPS